MGHKMTNNSVARGRQGVAAGVGCAALLCSGTWGQCEIAELVAPDPQPEMFYGLRVDTTPDVSTAVVAAHGRNNAAGGVYVFAFDPDETAWLLQTILTAPDPEPGRRFGEDEEPDVSNQTPRPTRPARPSESPRRGTPQSRKRDRK